METVKNNTPESFTVKRLTDGRDWYRSDALITVHPWPCWFPLEALCDVKDHKYVAMREFSQVKIGGNMGSATVGVGSCDISIAIQKLEGFGLRFDGFTN